LEVRINLAAAYAATGNRSGAEREYREVLRRKPDSASAFTGFANLSLKSGADEEAISYLMKAVSIAPNAFGPRFLLGSVYNRLGQFQEAESELQAALRLGGEGPEVDYQLAGLTGAGPTGGSAVKR
jgi:Flp pilus assembly protein TadD